MCNHYRHEIRKAGLSTQVYGFEEFSDGALEFTEMRWGVPPPDGPKKLRTNTRRLHLPFWKPWLGPEHRCLVPFTSFAEWVEGSNGKPKEMWFGPSDGNVGYIAGIWRPWTGTRGTKADPVTGDHLVFSLVTSDPNNRIAQFHDRMPTILPDRASQAAWLTAPAKAVPAFQKPVADEQLVILSDLAEFAQTSVEAGKS